MNALDDAEIVRKTFWKCSTYCGYKGLLIEKASLYIFLCCAFVKEVPLLVAPEA